MRKRLPRSILAAAVVLAACSGGDSAPTTASAPAAATTSTLLPTTSPAPPSTLPPATTTAPAATVPPTVPPAAEPGRREIELTVDGRQRRYVLYVPDGLDGGAAALVVDLHGLTSTPDGQERVSAMRAEADDAGFVVAQPAAGLVANAWDTLAGSADVAFALAIVRDVSTRVAIDPGRVFAAGFSAGGGMAARLACDAASTFAAVAVVAGAHVGWRRCAPDRPVAVIAFHGDADIVVPYRGLGLLPDIRSWAQGWADADGCNGDPDATAPAPDVEVATWSPCDDGTAVVLYTIIGGGHGWPGTPDPSREGDTTDTVSATEVAWEFFVQHGRS